MRDGWEGGFENGISYGTRAVGFTPAWAAILSY